MTALPKPPLMFSGSVDAAFVGGLLTFHAENVVALPDRLIDCIRAADALKREERDLGQEIVRHDPSAVRRVDLDALKSAAAAGRPLADAGAAAAERQRDQDALRLRYALVNDASTEAANELGAAIINGVGELGALLLGALTATLREATEPAVVMRAGSFAWTDPGALLGADKTTQAAFASLSALAARHDRLRGAAVRLADQVPAWQGIGDFTGHGVERAAGSFDRRWLFRPAGHPVQRLVAAAPEGGTE